MQRLTNKEIQQRQERRLLYHCDEKYLPGHHCKQRELSVLMVQEDEGNENELEEELSQA